MCRDALRSLDKRMSGKRRREAVEPEAQAPASWFETRPRHLKRKHYNERMKKCIEKS